MKVEFNEEQRMILHFCWNVHLGLKKSIAPDRIKKYADWFWLEYLKHYFQQEDQWIKQAFPRDDPGIRRILSNHRKIKKRFEDNVNSVRNLRLLEEELENTIRYEHRKIATMMLSSDYLGLGKTHLLEWHDEFWK